MSTMRFLIVHGTHYGQTAQIAEQIAEVIRSTGGALTVINGRYMTRTLSPRGSDGVAIGGSIQRNRHQRFLVDFAANRRPHRRSSDTSREHCFTDWEQVEQFAFSFGSSVSEVMGGWSQDASALLLEN
ncbi:MAG: flavodoxin domain-containing protein [Gemmatimonadota bacterium]